MLLQYTCRACVSRLNPQCVASVWFCRATWSKTPDPQILYNHAPRTTTQPPQVRPLVLVLKVYLAQRQFNEPRHGGIGSFLLQVCCRSPLCDGGDVMLSPRGRTHSVYQHIHARQQLVLSIKYANYSRRLGLYGFVVGCSLV